jgi:hypothetical protein
VYFGGQAVLNSTWFSASLLKMTAPPLNQSMYQNVTMFNPDGGWSHTVNAVFYTNNCPVEGMCLVCSVPFCC